MHRNARLYFFHRILDSLTMLSDSLDLTATSNSSDGKLTFGFNNYAMQLQDIDPGAFNGQTFSVNLGSVEDALISDNGFNNSLKTSNVLVEVMNDSTAAIQLPENFIQSIEGNNLTSNQLRLSFAVFLTDILFQSENDTKMKIGSIIVSTRLKLAEQLSLFSQITTTFRTNQDVCYPCIHLLCIASRKCSHIVEISNTSTFTEKLD